MTVGDWSDVLLIIGGSATFLAGILIYMVRRDEAIRQSTVMGVKMVDAIEALAQKLTALLPEKKHTEICQAQEKRFGDMVEEATSSLEAKLDNLRDERDRGHKEVRERLDKMDALREMLRSESDAQTMQIVSALGRLEGGMESLQGVMKGLQEKVSLR